jgi:uncharacterized protein DUF1931
VTSSAQKTYHLLLRGQATAKANGRDIIAPCDLPITKGLQESMHDFRELDAEMELQSILAYITAQPPLDLLYSVETEAELPGIVGGLSVALRPHLQARRGARPTPDLQHMTLQMLSLITALLTVRTDVQSRAV